MITHSRVIPVPKQAREPFPVVLAVDPGQNSGVVVARIYSSIPERLSVGETILDGLYTCLSESVKEYDPTVILQESVVMHGMLNADKAAQIRAYQTTRIIAEGFDIAYVEITPEERKQALKVKGLSDMPHARDALALIYAWIQRTNRG